MDKKFFKIRNYHPRDFDDYLKLHRIINAHDQSGRGISKQRLAEELGHPSFHPDNDLFVAESGGCIIGFASVFLEPGIHRAILECMIHPQHRRHGVATALLREVSRHAGEADCWAMQVCIPQANLAARGFASRLGFKFIRHFYELKLDLDTIRLRDREPSGYIFRRLEHHEADTLTYIQNRAFADSWGFNPNTPDEIAYRINLSSCSPENILMVYLKKRAIAYCWTRVMIEDHPAAGSMKGEIHMLGVDPDFRKKGIGRSVLLAGLADLKSRGVAIVELTADGEDPAALGLYESVGFKIFSRAEWYEKKLI